MRARRAKAARRPQMSRDLKPGIVIENVTQTRRRLAETTLLATASLAPGSSSIVDEGPTNTGSGSQVLKRASSAHVSASHIGPTRSHGPLAQVYNFRGRRIHGQGARKSVINIGLVSVRRENQSRRNGTTRTRTRLNCPAARKENA